MQYSRAWIEIIIILDTQKVEFIKYYLFPFHHGENPESRSVQSSVFQLNFLLKLINEVLRSIEFAS